MPVSSTAQRIPGPRLEESRRGVGFDRAPRAPHARARRAIQADAPDDAGALGDGDEALVDAGERVDLVARQRGRGRDVIGRPWRSSSIEPTTRISFWNSARVGGGARRPVLECAGSRRPVARAGSKRRATRCHQMVSGSASRSSSRNVSDASTTDSLNRTRAGAGPAAGASGRLRGVRARHAPSSAHPTRCAASAAPRRADRAPGRPRSTRRAGWGSPG